MAMTTKTLKNITILPVGTRGDIQPYVAIGAKLKEAGYNVRIFTNPSETHISLVESFGLTFVSFSQDVENAMEENELVREAMATGDAGKFFQAMAEGSEADAELTIKQFIEEMRSNPPDLLIVTPLTDYFGLYAKYKLNIPTVSVHLQGIAYDPKRAPFGFPALPFGLHYHILKFLLKSTYDKYIIHDEKISQIQGESPVIDNILPKEQFMESFNTKIKSWRPFPTFVCQSPLFRDILWPNTDPMFQYIGAAIIPKEQQIEATKSFGESKSEITAFIKNGNKKPVYLGWGSMISKSAEHMALFAVKALKEINQRGIILGGWANIGMEALEKVTDDSSIIEYARKNVLFVDKAPHEWLFPQVACTVHHGGAGTTTVALRSGKGMVITPVFVDQFDHAHFVNELGVGVGFSKQLQKITPSELASAITKVISDPNITEKAKEVGEIVLAEDGARTLVEKVEDYWKDTVQSGVIFEENNTRIKEVKKWRAQQARKKKIIQRSLMFVGAVAMSSTVGTLLSSRNRSNSIYK